MFVGHSLVSRSRSRLCPRCQDYALRVRRRLIDRILHPFTPVRRYRCMSTDCGWVGNLKPGQRMVGDAADSGDARKNADKPVLETAGSGGSSH